VELTFPVEATTAFDFPNEAASTFFYKDVIFLQYIKLYLSVVITNIH